MIASYAPNSIANLSNEFFLAFPRLTPKIMFLTGVVAAVAGGIFIALGAISWGALPAALSIAACTLGGGAMAGGIYYRRISTLNLERLLRNSQKAIDEHAKKEPMEYATPAQAIPSQFKLAFSSEKKFLVENFAAEEQGRRPSMEDAHFFTNISEGILFGVFDGHGGSEVAEYAAKHFAKLFTESLEEVFNNPYKAFNRTFSSLQDRILRKGHWHHQGSTAVISFVDKAKRIFTATLGDSEVNIYRKNQLGQWKSIPLSCVRDWSSLKDAKRAAQALQKPSIAEEWPKLEGKPRFPHPTYGLNISRSLGDAYLNEWPLDKEKDGKSYPAIIQKPKITVNQLERGDLLIAACDGLKDFASEKEIIENIEENAGEVKALAPALAKLSLSKQTARQNDNVTVMAIKLS